MLRADSAGGTGRTGSADASCLSMHSTVSFLGKF